VRPEVRPEVSTEVKKFDDKYLMDAQGCASISFRCEIFQILCEDEPPIRWPLSFCTSQQKPDCSRLDNARIKREIYFSHLPTFQSYLNQMAISQLFLHIFDEVEMATSRITFGKGSPD
jgi:hypothetical protein